MKSFFLLQVSKKWSVLTMLTFCCIFCLVSCKDADTLKTETFTKIAPDLNKQSGIEYYSPDSGGVSTQMVLKGYNLGTDTSFLKVTVNGKNAKIIGVRNDFVYAVVPVRADTGFVKLYVTRGENTEEFTFKNEFLYKFVKNVTTYAGKDIDAKRVDGNLADARVKRPWFILTDKENVLYFLEEGRGSDKNGALRRIINGQVETLYQNNAGPFKAPIGLAFSPKQDTLYVAQWYNSDAQTDGAVLYCTRDGGFVNMKMLVNFNNAKTTTVVAHPITGEVFFNSQLDGYIYRYTGNGTNPKSYERIYQINNASNTDIQMVFSKDGKTLYFTVRNRHCIFKADYNAATGVLSPATLWVGAWDESGYANGQAGAARFLTPGGADFDKDGNMYVADKGNHVLRKITPDGHVSLHAGLPKTAGYKDGGPVVAKFREPEGVTILEDGATYVADRGTACIRRAVVE